MTTARSRVFYATEFVENGPDEPVRLLSIEAPALDASGPAQAGA